MIVCPEDWEPRNILDFYIPYNDFYPLPFVRVDDNEGRTTSTGNNGQGVKNMLVGGFLVGSKLLG